MRVRKPGDGFLVIVGLVLTDNGPTKLIIQAGPYNVVGEMRMKAAYQRRDPVPGRKNWINAGLISLNFTASCVG